MHLVHLAVASVLLQLFQHGTTGTIYVKASIVQFLSKAKIDNTYDARNTLKVETSPLLLNNNTRFVRLFVA